MQNLLLLLIAAGSSSLCACTAQPVTHVEPARPAPTIVVREPRAARRAGRLCSLQGWSRSGLPGRASANLFLIARSPGLERASGLRAQTWR